MSFSVVSEIAIVPDSECKTPTLIVSAACAKETERPTAEAKMVFLKVRFQDRVCIEILHLKLLAMTLAKGISAENVPTRLGSHLATDFKENT